MVRLLCNLTHADVFATPHVTDLNRLRGVSVSMKVMSWERPVAFGDPSL